MPSFKSQADNVSCCCFMSQNWMYFKQNTNGKFEKELRYNFNKQMTAKKLKISIIDGFLSLHCSQMLLATDNIKILYFVYYRYFWNFATLKLGFFDYEKIIS